jgi:hypothetical protein
VKIGELFVALSFKVDGQGDLVKAYNDVQNLGRASGALALGIGVMSAGFVAMISESAAAGNALKNFQLTTGLSTDSLQQWEYRAQRAGVGAGVVQGAITKMATKMGEVIKSGQFTGFTGWTVFGVDPSANPFETFDRLNAKFKTLNDPNKLNLFRSFATDLGISDNLVALFRRDLTGIELPKKLLLDQQNIDDLDLMYGKILGIKVEIENAGGKFSSVFGPAVDDATAKVDLLAKRWADFSNKLNSGTPKAEHDKGLLNTGVEVAGVALLGLTGLAGVIRLTKGVVNQIKSAVPLAVLGVRYSPYMTVAAAAYDKGKDFQAVFDGAGGRNFGEKLNTFIKPPFWDPINRASNALFPQGGHWLDFLTKSTPMPPAMPMSPREFHTTVIINNPPSNMDAKRVGADAAEAVNAKIYAYTALGAAAVGF